VRADPTAFTAYHGRVDARRSLDPRDNPSEIMSATRLETLGTCPHRYLIRYVLGIRPPDDPDLQPDRWLSPMHRGSLLHSVYERSLRTMTEQDLDVEDAAFETIALSGLAAELKYWRDALPPPGESVYGVEADALREDVQAFVRMVRETAHEWIALERRFGRGSEPPIEIGLKGGVIRLTGAIDRIDRLPDGGVAVIDYKTGSTYDFGNRGDTYRGGRRLQHVLYAAVAHQLYGNVRRAEYHFPTRGGENHRRPYEIEDLRKGLAVVDNLASLAAHGYFHPTTEPADCRFCDFQRVCRVKVDGGRVDSPLAEWAKDRSAVLGELKLIDTLRRWRG
jgi:ATP-dependent helicase/nuclease subunit B